MVVILSLHYLLHFRFYTFYDVLNDAYLSTQHHSLSMLFPYLTRLTQLHKCNCQNTILDQFGKKVLNIFLIVILIT